MTPDLTRLRNDVQVSQSGTISVEDIALTLTLTLSMTIFYKLQRLPTAELNFSQELFFYIFYS